MFVWEISIITISIVEGVFIIGVYLASKYFDWLDKKDSTRVVPV